MKGVGCTQIAPVEDLSYPRRKINRIISTKGNKTRHLTGCGIHELKPATQMSLQWKGGLFFPLLIYISIWPCWMQTNGEFLKGWHQSCGDDCHIRYRLLYHAKVDFAAERKAAHLSNHTDMQHADEVVVKDGNVFFRTRGLIQSIDTQRYRQKLKGKWEKWSVCFTFLNEVITLTMVTFMCSHGAFRK